MAVFKYDWSPAFAMAAAGMTLKEISVAIGASRPSTSEWARRNGVTVKRKPLRVIPKRCDIAPERVREVFDYDPLTGVFRRRKARSGDTKIGYTAHSGYVRIGIDGLQIEAHRLAWAYVHGVWPGLQIDHINGDKLDNRIANLRDVSARVNCENLRFSKSKVQGLLGAANESNGTYVARLRSGNLSIRVGGFATKEAAHAAYVELKRIFHEGCTL